MLDITNGYETGRFVGSTILPMVLGAIAAYGLYKYFERKDLEAEDEED